MPLHDQTITQFLDSLADRTPAPGGGATAALHVAQGAALVAMVARYSDGPRYDAHRERITHGVTAADALRQRSLALAADDEAAFSAVAAAYALPRATPEEQQARRAAIGAALAGAAEPPIAVVGAARDVVELAADLVPVANRNLVADLAAAAEAARAGATTARVNIEVNLGGIDDAAARERCLAAVAEVDLVGAAAERVTAEVRAGLAR